MSSQFKWALGILIVACAAAYLMVSLRPEPEKETPVRETPLVNGVKLEPASGTIPVIASGTVQPRDEVVIGAQVAGKLVYVNPAFREGRNVPSGSVLVRIDQTDYRNQVRIAQADVAAQNVAVQQAREEVKIARSDLQNFAARENERRRMTSTVDASDYAARILPPEGIAGSGNRAGNRIETPSRATQGGSPLATRVPQLRSAEAQRQRATATLADAQTALSRTKITAPFSGLVRQESAAVGTLVQVGQSLGTIASNSAYDVRLFLSESEAALIPGLLQGSGGSIRADVLYQYGGLTYRWPAVVDRADASLDATTRNIEVFLRVPNPIGGGRLADDDQSERTNRAPPLLLGAFVSAQIDGASMDSFAAIPVSAVRPGNQIWVVRGGKLRTLSVRVIQRTDQLAYITTPSLEEGGLLVTSALTSATDGMAVRTSSKPAS